jgi:hypothetical protein
MDSSTARNQQFLRDLFAGPFPGHAIIMDAEQEPQPFPGDIANSDEPVSAWLDWGLRGYEGRLRWHEAVDDDSVPQAIPGTGTQIFAAAFGSPVHIYEDSPPAAMPAVETAEEADRLETPSPFAPPLDRVWEYAGMLRDRLGRDVIMRVPDIQSPFDIAALIWRKEAFYMALLDNPAAVKRLVGKCQDLLTRFLQEWLREFPNASLAHCPNAWAPAELGCWLSEDEAGAMSVPMFEEFCVPVLADLSREFGGLFIHCCATADHQYASFSKVPDVRGMNRVFQAPGPEPAVEAFSGRSVLMMAWMAEDQVNALLDMARPDTRYLFNMGAQPLEESRRTCERLRERCRRL